MESPLPPEDRAVSVSRVIDAPAAEIMDLLRNVHRHKTFDGSGTIQGLARGPVRLKLGSNFSMEMRQGFGYRTRSRVVEYEPDRLLTWRTGVVVRDHWLLGGQGWRWELEPLDEGHTRVTHTYLWGWARPAFPLGASGLPERMQASMSRTVDRLAEAVAEAAAEAD